MKLATAAATLAKLIGDRCDRCLKLVVRTYASPSPVYTRVCEPCANGDNGSWVSK